MFILQIVTGIMIDGALVGIIYTKLVQPPKRPFDFKFSQNAVICQRDSKLCLLFRVCDPSELHAVGTKVRAHLIERKMYVKHFICNDFLSRQIFSMQIIYQHC